MANTKKITFDQLQSSMNKVKSAIDTTMNSHMSNNTHVTYSTSAPSSPGSASAGTANTVSRGDHVHPLQTTVSGSSGSCTGNAATATKLQTARTINLTGEVSGSVSFDGSSDISIATSIQYPKSGSWFNNGYTYIATSGVMEVGKYLDFHNTSESTNDYDLRLQVDNANQNTVTLPSSSGTLALTTDNVASATQLKTARTINGTNFDGTANITTANWGTARTLTIGNTGKSVNGSSNVSWTLSDIGAVNKAGDTITGQLVLSQGSRVHQASANGGTSGYLFIGQIVISGNYQNQPIRIGLCRRNDPEITNLTICFYNLDGTDPDISSYIKTGPAPIYIYKSAASTWNIYVTKAESYDSVDILYYNKGAYMSSTTVIWKDELVSELPTGYLTVLSNNDLFTTNVYNNTLYLSNKKYQCTTLYSNTTISLPSVSDFTEIHLFFDWPSGISITMPNNITWQGGVVYGPGYKHEFIFTYVNSTIGWLGGCILYE